MFISDFTFITNLLSSPNLYYNSHYEKFADGTVKCIDDEIPFDIPESWCWERWGNLSQSIQYGYNAPALNKGDIRMVRISDIQNGEVLWETVPFCNIKENEIDTYLLNKNDILFARTGGTVGKSFLVKETPYPAIYAGYLIRTRYSEMLSAKYMKYFMESNLYWVQLKDGTIATAQPNCNGKTLGKMILPLPPLSEQNRIVSRIEELMATIDKFEQSKIELDKLESELQPQLKKSILQYAIQGKLVAQNPTDEPASELLKRINEEKEQLIKDGKIKRDKNTSVIFKGDDNKYYEKLGKSVNDITDDLPFEIPHNWEWTTLNMVTYSVGNKINQIQTKDILKTGNIPVVSQGQSLIDGYCEAKNKVVTDLPLIMFGDHTRNVKCIDFPFVIGADGTKVHKCICISADFLYFWMVVIAEQLRDRGYARHYSLLKKTYFPLPPLNEQYRIVKKIKQILKGIEG